MNHSDLVRDLALALDRGQDPSLRDFLIELEDRLPNSGEDLEHCQFWWRTNGATWFSQLRAVMIEHRNIGHDWQFSDAQKELLNQYYEANLLLVACLNSDCYVSREVRQEIEDNLLLPISDIEQNCSNPAI